MSEVTGPHRVFYVTVMRFLLGEPPFSRVQVPAESNDDYGPYVSQDEAEKNLRQNGWERKDHSFWVIPSDTHLIVATVESKAFKRRNQLPSASKK
jgi:hypothetical protein